MFQLPAIFFGDILYFYDGAVCHTLSAILDSEIKNILHEIRNRKIEKTEAHKNPWGSEKLPEIKMSLHPTIKWLRGFHTFRAANMPVCGAGYNTGIMKRNNVVKNDTR
jgi:hypothetical protein